MLSHRKARQIIQEILDTKPTAHPPALEAFILVRLTRYYLIQGMEWREAWRAGRAMYTEHR